MKFGLILFAMCMVIQPIVLILESHGMKQVGRITNLEQLFSLNTLWRVATNPYIVCGVVLAVLALIFWLGVLSNLNVSYIYPFASVTYIILAILAVVFLKEDISVSRWAGIVVIALGCYLINR